VHASGQSDPAAPAQCEPLVLRPAVSEPELEGAPSWPSAAALSSPFSPVERPRQAAHPDTARRAASQPAAARLEPRRSAVTLAEIEALSFEEKAALFS
jgi:hypothetical protein